MAYFGAAYTVAIILWLTQGGHRPFLFLTAVLAVSIFLLVRGIERHKAVQKQVEDDLATARTRRRERERAADSRARAVH